MLANGVRIRLSADRMIPPVALPILLTALVMILTRSNVPPICPVSHRNGNRIILMAALIAASIPLVRPLMIAAASSRTRAGAFRITQRIASMIPSTRRTATSGSASITPKNVSIIVVKMKSTNFGRSESVFLRPLRRVWIAPTIILGSLEMNLPTPENIFLKALRMLPSLA